jgi:predicted O-methyltransferase YrrM
VEVDVGTVERLFPVNLRLRRDARSIGATLERGRELDGLLEEREGACLYMLARWGGRVGAVAEIGSWKGRSTWYLARGLADSGSAHRVIAIDPHLEGTHDEFTRNLEATGIAERVEPRVARAEEAGDVEGPVGLLWIDGDHSYAGVRRDFEQWFPRLETGGWLAFHDTANRWLGPTRLVRELLVSRSDLASVGVIGTITYAQKAWPSTLNRARAVAARGAFEVVTAAWGARVGFGPREWAPGER